MRLVQRVRIITAGVAVLTAIIVLSSVPVHGQSKTATEQALKVALVFNFAKFVTWPPETFPDDHAPLVIAVLGARFFADRLDEMTTGKLVKGRPLVIRRLREASQKSPFHILFVDSSKAGASKRLLASLSTKPVLTVGDTHTFLASGGMIELVTRGDIVSFRVNTIATKRAGLKISAKLLRVAETVDD